MSGFALSEDAVFILVFEACLYVAWFIFDILNQHKDDDDNPFAGWW